MQIFLASVYLRLGTKQQSKTCDGGFCSHQDGLVAFQGFATTSDPVELFLCMLTKLFSPVMIVLNSLLPQTTALKMYV